MKTQYQYIHFSLVIRPKGWKTDIYQCCNNKSGEELGVVKWYTGWRQYCYFPTVQAVYNKRCLDDIADFIKEISK